MQNTFFPAVESNHKPSLHQQKENGRRSSLVPVASIVWEAFKYRHG
jgi:hypothetical protein